jgi:hypothetical protein
MLSEAGAPHFFLEYMGLSHDRFSETELIIDCQPGSPYTVLRSETTSVDDRGGHMKFM